MLRAGIHAGRTRLAIRSWTGDRSTIVWTNVSGALAAAKYW
jgi:hypothetical protein